MPPGATANIDQELDLEGLDIGRHLAGQNRELRHRCAREAALRANAEPLHRRIAASLLEPAHQVVGRFERRVFGTDDAEIGTLIRRQMTQWREISGPPRVVLEQK